MVFTGKRFSPSLDCISSGSGVWKRSTVNQVSCGTFINAGEMLWQTSHFFHSFFRISSPFTSYPLDPIGIKEWLRKTEATRGSMFETLCLRSRFPSRNRPAARAIQKAVRHLAVNRLVPGLEGSVLCSKRGRKSKEVRHLEHARWCVVVEHFSGVCEVFGNTICVVEYVQTQSRW